MAHMDRVKEHLSAAARAHRELHQHRLLEAAIARAEADAARPPEVPDTGLQVDGTAGDGMADD